MMITRLTLCATALVVLSVTGCARTDDGAPAGTSAGAPASAPSSQPAETPSAAGAETVTGTVVAGVEPNCLLLEGAGDPRLLVFKDETLRATAKVGSRVTVSGNAEPGMMTTCQQGIPFMVTSISAG
jgi:hypothetical protein